MFDRYEAGEQAVLVHINFTQEGEWEDLAECEMLVTSAGVEVLQVITGSRQSPHPKYYVGEGKAQEIAQAVKSSGAEIVIFNHSLSPAQERNLEHLFKCRVLDRTGLILDIFAQRARTHEGKLQVELAQLRHISTRLIRGWTHLERQKGGIGLRGPGETQLETDRRLLRDRIKAILRRLEKVAKQREQGRRARNRAEIPTISLVGYTNAGKSTLFNRITEAGVYAADQLFATLDPTLRKIELSDVGTAILADTVGFIRHLPHDLVAAFKATLQETQEADILLHVVDASDERFRENIQAVHDVLEEIDAHEVPTLVVMNKIDNMEGQQPRIEYDDEGMPQRVWVSAMEGVGIELLFEALTQRLASQMVQYQLRIPPQYQGRFRSTFFQLKSIQQEAYDEQGNLLIDVRMQQVDWSRLEKREGAVLGDFIVT
ncbi:GTP-binding protein hflX [Vibrio nigripulchritudo MADA3029]|uniref:ribosome rescue GTPase HflX n=1 Tax=Vibrio nigripulchritudo TaxID=28173 RepID=UPI0003B1896E|nr:ribosome rescue GTPase HflX [Vibrio nigripulchritudo]CCN50335.1 GTP-binding protein hflX [Vibrio nigripulchritudo MADA3020]CCN53516.1 GTP-binding protein hflX [Vibrio nigripulchritudo MADA3021]CCN61396.1 GTP-binding protein hflX [Vibrio nigripulchritudo MADA3029]CCN72062.1 GTP-binding protein hflX [Vibrio nigripulchritudo SFn118]